MYTTSRQSRRQGVFSKHVAFQKAATLILCIPLLYACAGKSPNAARAQDRLQPIPSEFFAPHFPTQQVSIEPGDLLTVRFYRHPELDSAQIVRPDGKIALTLLQGFPVAGRSPEEVQHELVEFYTQEFVAPMIAVEIEKRAEVTAFVTGQVEAGGVKPILENSTVAQILAQSSVKERDADLRSVVLVRKHSPEKYIAYLVDARFENGAERDVYVAPGDIIVVPRNAITVFGDFIQKYIRDIIPPQMILSYGVTKEITD